MNDFAEYIINEEELSAKIEIAYYLAKKTRIFFDKSVIFKTEITRLFLNYAKIDVDHNFVLTASLLCNCKKVDDAQNIERVRTFAKEGADYLDSIGFGKKFCKVCEEVNRYSNSNPREKESDILELVDQYGGLLLDRSERDGFKPDEALILLEHRNLKGQYNRYLETFMEFIKYIEQIEMNDIVSMTALRRLVKIYKDADKVSRFIQKVIDNYEPQIDRLIAEKNNELAKQMFDKVEDNNRPLFSLETTKKIMSKINSENKLKIGNGEN